MEFTQGELYYRITEAEYRLLEDLGFAGSFTLFNDYAYASPDLAQSTLADLARYGVRPELFPFLESTQAVGGYNP